MAPDSEPLVGTQLLWLSVQVTLPPLTVLNGPRALRLRGRVGNGKRAGLNKMDGGNRDRARPTLNRNMSQKRCFSTTRAA